MCARMCVCFFPVFIQDPPKSAINCKMDGVVTATVIIITAPVLTTDDESCLGMNIKPIWITDIRECDGDGRALGRRSDAGRQRR